MVQLKGGGGRTLLRVNLPDVSGLKLVAAEFRLFLDSLLVTLSKANELVHPVHVVVGFPVEIAHLESLGPDVLVQIHEHVLLQTRLAIVDRNAVVVSVQAVDERLNGRLVQVAQIGCCLPGFLAHHNGLGLNQSEGIDDNLALDGLDGIDDHGDSTRRELFKRLLGVDIDGREPAAETRVRVVPTDNGFGPS